MESARKKENIETVRKRVARYRSKPDFDCIQITNITPSLKQEFLSLPGETYAEKFTAAIEAWKKQNRKTEVAKFTISGPITSGSLTPGNIYDNEEPEYEIQPENKSGPLFKGKINTLPLPHNRFTSPKKNKYD